MRAETPDDEAESCGVGERAGVGSCSDGLGQDRAVAELFSELRPRLTQALLAYGGRPETVEDAVGDTFAYLCANAERILAMENPRGYLYRVARDRMRGSRRRPVFLPPIPPSQQPEIEPALLPALAGLSRNQRTTVFLATGLGWSWSEVAEFLGIGISSVRNHHHRGMEKLRREMGGQS